MSETVKKVQRPLSPHLQVYKLPLTAIMSITHRVTGAGLAAGTVLVTAFLLAAASGEQAYNAVAGVASSLPGQVIIFLWSLALFYHMCNGVRHLFWDVGMLLEKDKAMQANYFVLAAALTLTVAVWAYACGAYVN